MGNFKHQSLRADRERDRDRDRDGDKAKIGDTTRLQDVGVCYSYAGREYLVTDGFRTSSQTGMIVIDWAYLCPTLEPTRNETLRPTSRQIPDQHKPSRPMPRHAVVRLAKWVARKKLVRQAKTGEEVDTIPPLNTVLRMTDEVLAQAPNPPSGKTDAKGRARAFVSRPEAGETLPLAGEIKTETERDPRAATVIVTTDERKMIPDVIETLTWKTTQGAGGMMESERKDWHLEGTNETRAQETAGMHPEINVGHQARTVMAATKGLLVASARRMGLTISRTGMTAVIRNGRRRKSQHGWIHMCPANPHLVSLVDRHQRGNWTASKHGRKA